MGMYLALAPVSDATIARLHADPPLAMQIFAPSDPDAVASARPRPRSPGLLGRLLGRRPEPPPPPAEPLVLAEGEGTLASIEKSWGGVHYLLTETAWEGDPPLNFLINGGASLDADGPWNTPPRTISAAEAREIAAALDRVSDEELERRYAPARMMELEIYPEIWDRTPSDEDDPLRDVMEGLGQVRDTVAGAVARGYGLVILLD